MSGPERINIPGLLSPSDADLYSVVETSTVQTNKKTKTEVEHDLSQKRRDDVWRKIKEGLVIILIAVLLLMRFSDVLVALNADDRVIVDRLLFLLGGGLVGFHIPRQTGK